jgi:hypothetical protein
MLMMSLLSVWVSNPTNVALCQKNASWPLPSAVGKRTPMSPVSHPPAPSETVTGWLSTLKCVVPSAISTVRFNSRLISRKDGTTRRSVAGGAIRGGVVGAAGIDVGEPDVGALPAGEVAVVVGVEDLCEDAHAATSTTLQIRTTDLAGLRLMASPLDGRAAIASR